MPSPLARKLRLLAPVSALLLAGACDLPLDPPVWSTAWTVPGASDTVSTGELLPDGVALDEPDGFKVEPTEASRSVVLGDVCPICTCFDGPIPPIPLAPQEFNVPLPGRLTRASLRRGRARMILHNELPFDLLDDGQGNTGFLTIRLRDRFSGATLDSLELTGSLPPEDSVEVSFDLADLELSRGVVVRVEGVTPGSPCDTITLDPEDGIRSQVFLEELGASDVSVIVTDESLSLPRRNLELPEAIADRLRAGEARVLLDVEVESTVALGMELLLSVATREEDLFTSRAALFTPVLVPPASGSDPLTVQKLFTLDVERIQGADSIFIDTRNRVDGDRKVLIRGGEAVRYTATLRADLPSR